jgi:hypothetical protein
MTNLAREKDIGGCIIEISVQEPLMYWIYIIGYLQQRLGGERNVESLREYGEILKRRLANKLNLN